MRTMWKILAAGALVLGGLLAFAAPAQAEPLHESVAACACVGGGGPQLDPEATQKLLPSERWRDATTLHGRYDQFLGNDVVAMGMRNALEAGSIGTGNAWFSLSASTVSFASNLAPLNAAGLAIDRAVKQIGDLLLGNGLTSGIVVFIVGVAVAVALFQARRGQRPWKRLISVAGLTGFIVLMVSGASTSGVDDAGNFAPGFFSPGWLATQVDHTISVVGGSPSIAGLALSGADDAAAPASSGCGIYLQHLSAAYVAASGGTGTIPATLSALWQDSGFVVFKQAQYGSALIDPAHPELGTFGDFVVCHQLDWQNGKVSAAAQASMTYGDYQSAKKAGFNEKSLAWGGTHSNEKIDRSMVAWAACSNDGSGKFSVRGGFAKHITAQNCSDWWSGSDQDLDAFDVGGGADDPASKYSDASVIDFLGTLHGNIVGPGLLASYAYSIAAIIIGVVFIGMSLMITIAKLAGLVSAFASLFVVLAQIVVGSTSNKLMVFVKSYIGYAVLAFSATFLLGCITLVTQILVGLGSHVFAPGDPFGLLWTGLCPALSVICFNLLITKVLRLPSPFRPSSGIAYASLANQVGGASFIRRAEDRAAGAIQRQTQKLTTAASNRARNALRGQGAKDRMQPARRPEDVAQPGSGPRTGPTPPPSGGARRGNGPKPGPALDSRASTTGTPKPSTAGLRNANGAIPMPAPAPAGPSVPVAQARQRGANATRYTTSAAGRVQAAAAAPQAAKLAAASTRASAIKGAVRTGAPQATSKVSAATAKRFAASAVKRL